MDCSDADGQEIVSKSGRKLRQVGAPRTVRVESYEESVEEWHNEKWIAKEKGAVQERGDRERMALMGDGPQ